VSDLLDRLRAAAARRAVLPPDAACPGDTVIDEVLSPSEVTIGGRRTLMLGSNNYLGLTFHPEVMAAAREALDRHGTGTTGSRVANGTLAMHRALEHDFAAFFGKRRALIFTTGYQANLAIISALCGPGDVVLMDAESHASIYDGARLCGADMLAFPHNAPDALARRLARLPAGARNRLVVVEGLYSIRGDVAPLEDIVAACREHGAYLLVDEAHSFGVYGARGLGCAEEHGVLGACDFIVGTFSKTLAGVGGFCVSDHPALDGVPALARSYVFTASGSPATIASARAALAVVAREPQLRERLWTNTRRLRARLAEAGCASGKSESPIVAIGVGDELTTVLAWQRLLEAGVYVNIVLPPACRADACLFRVSCSAAHTPDQIDHGVAAIAQVLRELR
jgi:8-amino-7-oxononanoate synthase